MATSTKNDNVTNKTDYARTLGYTGKKEVLLLDGKVISHRQADWFDFCERLSKS